MDQEISLIYLLAGIFVMILLSRFVIGNARPRIKGAIGESKVAWRLNRLRGAEYAIFNDVLIPSGRGTNQIDHVVVSVYGIFVIETKNYGGWIHGHEHADHWTQTFYRNKTRITNPVRQNLAHIHALKKVLSDFKQVRYHPVRLDIMVQS